MPGRTRPWILALAAAALLTPALALADNDVVATGGTSDKPPVAGSSAEDILRRLEAIPSRDDYPEVAPPFTERPTDRKPHGSMSLEIGTGGYRSVAGDVVIPVGENGMAGLAIQLTEGGYRRGGRGRR